MPGIELQIDTTSVAILADAFGANMEQMQAAEVRALNKTMKWVRTHSVRAVSKEMKVAAKLVRQRIRAFKATRRHRIGKVWAGLEPIAAHRLGRTKQNRRGVRAGRHLFPGAFTADVGRGKLVVFKRTGEPKRQMKRGRYAKRNIKREPIERVELEMDQQAITDALDDLFAGANERFFEILRQELNYQVFVKGKK